MQSDLYLDVNGTLRSRVRRSIVVRRVSPLVVMRLRRVEEEEV